jgi:uncharacterized C2H2 Zn-finger protein
VGESGHHCPKCSKTFSNEKELSRHVCESPDENEESVKKCQKCRKTFKTSKNFLIHVKKCIGGDGNDASATTAPLSSPSPRVTSSTMTLKCMLCDAVFYSAEELRRHGLERHQVSMLLNFSSGLFYT